jgi:hypothetical protein
MCDWVQQQPACHDYFAHHQSFLNGDFWQFHCVIPIFLPFSIPPFLFLLFFPSSFYSSWVLAKALSI